MSFEAGVFSNVISSFDGDQHFGVVWYRRSSTWNLTNVLRIEDIYDLKIYYRIAWIHSACPTSMLSTREDTWLGGHVTWITFHVCSAAISLVVSTGTVELDDRVGRSLEIVTGFWNTRWD